MKRIPLSILLLLILGIGFSFILGASLWLERARLETRLVERETADLRAVLANLAVHADYAFKASDGALLDDKLVRLAADPEINGVALIDPAGMVVAASRREWLGAPAVRVVPGFDAARQRAALANGVPRIDTDAARSRMTGYERVTWPLRPGELRTSRFGTAFIDYDLHRQRAALWAETWQRTLTTWLLVLAMLAGVYFLIDRLLQRPLRNMVGALRRFQEGDLDVRLQPGPGRELVALAGGFNAMADEYAATLRAIPDLLFELDGEGRYCGVWACDTTLLAAQRDALMGRTVADVLPADAARTVMDALREAAAGGHSAGRQISLPLPTGTHWFELSVARKRVRGGEMPRFMLLSRDITPRKVAEIELAESMRFARATLDALSSHIAILDAAGTIIATNRAWDAFAQDNGGDAAQIGVGSNYLAACDNAPGDDGLENGAIAAAIRDVIAGRRDAYLYEYPCHSPQERRWYYCRVTRFPGEGPVRVVVAHENITALKEAEARRDASESAFETLAAVAPVGILQFAADGACVAFNRRWRELSGLGDARGERWLDAICADDRQRVRSEWAHVRQGGRAARMEYRLRHAGGETLWVLADVAPVYDRQGAYSGWLMTLTDVSAQKRTEQALRLLSDDLARFSGDAFFTHLTYHLAELLDVDIAAVCRTVPGHPAMAQTLALVVDGEAQPDLCYETTALPCAQVLAHGSFLRLAGATAAYPELAALLGDGVAAYAGVALQDANGRRYGHLSVLSRRRFAADWDGMALLRLFAAACVAELERAGGRKRFADLFEFSSDANLLVGGDGRIVAVNREAERLFGYARADLIGEAVEMLVPDAQRAHHRDLRAGYAHKGYGHMMAAGRADLKARCRDGRLIDVEISLTPLESDEGMLIAASIRDVSERVRIAQALERSAEALRLANAAVEAERDTLEQRVAERTAALTMANAALKQASRDKDQFLATMSHEIRTPLNGMLGMLELLGLGELSGEQRQQLRIAADSGQSLMRIIDDILDYSKIGAGKLSLHPRPAALATTVAEVRDMFLANAAVKRLALTAQVDERIAPALLFDPLRVGQILKNFVSNAIKFTETGGVTIRAEWLGGEDGQQTVRLSVADTGIGISAAAQRRLFRPYEQVHDDGGRLYGGTGLGLSICQRLAEMMGGEIAVQSTPGKGTTMSLTLRLAVAQADAAGAAPAPAAVSLATLSSNGLPILAVDDHPVNRTLLARQLEALGLPVVLAEDGAKALQLWRHGRFALVITDCHMPEMDGYTLTARIREIETHEGRARTPVIAWTAKAFSEDVDLCTRVGMDDFLAKPAALRVLAQTLAKWLPAAPTDEAAPAPEPLDPAALEALATDAAERAAILGDYLTQTRADVADLKAAAARGDRAALARIAHRMKGASQMVGAGALHALCVALEETARAQTGDVPSAVLESIEAAVARIGGDMEHKDDEAVAHASQDEEPVFDRQVLAEMLGDDVAAQRELLADYRAAAGQLRGALDAAYAAHDGEALARIAHKLKSSSRAVGAMQLGAASAALERAGRERDWAGIAAAYDALRAADARLTAVLGS